MTKKKGITVTVTYDGKILTYKDVLKAYERTMRKQWEKYIEKIKDDKEVVVFT